MAGEIRLVWDSVDHTPPVGNPYYVRASRLGLHLIPRVPVRVRRETKLGTVERFVLSAGLTRPLLKTRLLAEATGIPDKALKLVLQRLRRRRLIEDMGPERFRVRPEAASQAMQRNILVEDGAEDYAFVLFARSGDLVAFRPGPDQEQIHWLLSRAPVGRAPVLSWISGQGQYDWIAKRVRERNVVQLPDDAVDVEVPDKDPPIPTSCARYDVSARLVDGGKVALESFTGAQGRREQERILLPRPPGLMHMWGQLADMVYDEAFTALSVQKLAGQSSEDDKLATAATGLRLTLSQSTCERVVRREDQRLAARRSLSIGDDENLVQYPVELLPGSPEAAALFGLDWIVHELTRGSGNGVTHDLDHLIRRAKEQYPVIQDVPVEEQDSLLSRRVVMDRLWRLRQYRVVYALREDEDFAYGT